MPDQLLSETASATIESMKRSLILAVEDLPYEDSHSNSLTTTATSLTLASDATQRLKAGDIIEWRAHATDTLNELALITAVAATSATVVRGYLSSTPGTGVTHSANARFAVKPGYYATNATKALQDAIDGDLYPELYAVYEAQLAHGSTGWNAVTQYQAIDATAEEVLSAYQKSDATPVGLMNVNVTQPFYVDSTLASSKKAVRLVEVADNDNVIFVQYLKKAAVGDLSAGMVKVVEAGAMARLLEWKGAHQLSKENRVVQDGVQVPGVFLRTAGYWRGEQARLKAQEESVLRNRFPRRQRKRTRPAHRIYTPR